MERSNKDGRRDGMRRSVMQPRGVFICAGVSTVSPSDFNRYPHTLTLLRSRTAEISGLKSCSSISPSSILSVFRLSSYYATNQHPFNCDKKKIAQQLNHFDFNFKISLIHLANLRYKAFSVGPTFGFWTPCTINFLP